MHMFDSPANTQVTGKPWITFVRNSILTTWREQAFFWPKDRSKEIKALVRSRPGLKARSRAVALLIEDVADRVTTPGVLTDEEYNESILKPLHAQLPFLDATVRKELARNLIAQRPASS
jgi:hypothetical protein